jgi:hypothetical protein
MSMAKANGNLTWAEIDPATLPETVQKAYEAYKAAYREMKECRMLFEAELNEAADPPKGKRVVCGYNFGKLSIALADAKEAPKAASKGTLADFLAGQMASGRRA